MQRASAKLPCEGGCGVQGAPLALDLQYIRHQGAASSRAAHSVHSAARRTSQRAASAFAFFLLNFSAVRASQVTSAPGRAARRAASGVVMLPEAAPM